VAAARAEAVVTRADRGTAEAQIAAMSRTWETQQVALAGRADAGRIDEFGHIVKRGAGYKAYRMHPAGPPIPPANSARETQRERDLRAAEASAQAAREAEERKKILARLREGSPEQGRFDPSRVRAADLQDLGYGEDTEESETLDTRSDTPKSQPYLAPPPPTRGRERGGGFER
jgi:hypothetical protein